MPSHTAHGGGEPNEVLLKLQVSSKFSNLTHGSDGGHLGVNEPVNRFPGTLYDHGKTTATQFKDAVKLLLIKIIVVLPIFPHSILVVSDGIELLLHMYLSAAVPTRQRKNACLDIGPKPHKSAV